MKMRKSQSELGTRKRRGQPRRRRSQMPPRFEVRVRPLRNEADLDWALAEIDKVVDAVPGSSGEGQTRGSVDAG